MRYVHEITLKELFSYFSTKGYKLTNVEPSQVSIGLEESIIAALLKKEPRLIEGIPILLKKKQS